MLMLIIMLIKVNPDLICIMQYADEFTVLQSLHTVWKTSESLS